MPRNNATQDDLPEDGHRRNPTDPQLPDWLVPNTLEVHDTDSGTPTYIGSDAIIIAPGATLTSTEAFQEARGHADGRRMAPLARLVPWLFLVVWVAASVMLAWGLDRTGLQPWTSLIIGFFFLLSGAIVYPEAVAPLARRLDERSRAAAPMTTDALLAQSTAAPVEPRARFISDVVEEMVIAIHRVAPQQDAKLHAAVWEWATTEDEAALAPIERLWKRADPQGYAKFMAELEDD